MSGLLSGIPLPLVIALAVMLIGVVGSVVPGIPSGLLSLAGLFGYWIWTGFTEPSTLAVAILGFVALIAFLADTFAGAVAAKQGGASTLTVTVGLFVALALSFVFGPFGFVLGLPLAILLIKYWKTEDSRESLRAAAYTSVGVLGSVVIQALLTLTVLIGFAYVTLV